MLATPIIALTPEEAAHAREVGHARNTESEARGRQDRLQSPQAPVSALAHVIGAAGQLAFCKFLGVPWIGRVGKFSDPDVVWRGHEFKVRVAARRLACKVAPRDKAHWLIAAVAEERHLARYRVMGWIAVGDARERQWLDNPGRKPGEEAYFVPYEKLHPFHDSLFFG